MTSSNTRRPLLGLATIAFAIAFNAPYSILAATFDYPGVLRRPAGEILTLFNAGAAELILTWHAFGLAAFLLIPLSILLSLRGDRIAAAPSLAMGAAIAGSLAGLTQVLGLWRWVFVVPSLARAYVDPASTDAAKAGAEAAFNLINLYGGVAVGEHLGQLLTALFVLLLSLVQWREGHRVTAVTGVVTTAAIVVGTGEGLAIALGRSGEVFGPFTTVGFLGLTVWLIMAGVRLVRGDRRGSLDAG